MSKRLDAFVLSNDYRIIDSPEPIVHDGTRRCALIDHQQHVIWIDPGVSPSARQRVILRAVCRAWQDRLTMLETVE